MEHWATIVEFYYANHYTVTAAHVISSFGDISWPARSPELTSPDNFFCTWSPRFMQTHQKPYLQYTESLNQKGNKPDSSWNTSVSYG